MQFKNIDPDSVTSCALRDFQHIFLYNCILYMWALCCLNDYEDTHSEMSEMCLDVSPWEVFSLLASADYTEYLICFCNWHSWGFGNTVKKDVRRSWGERWSERRGEREGAGVREQRWNERAGRESRNKNAERKSRRDLWPLTTSLLVNFSFTIVKRSQKH